MENQEDCGKQIFVFGMKCHEEPDECCVCSEEITESVEFPKCSHPYRVCKECVVRCLKARMNNCLICKQPIAEQLCWNTKSVFEFDGTPFDGSNIPGMNEDESYYRGFEPFVHRRWTNFRIDQILETFAHATLSPRIDRRLTKRTTNVDREQPRDIVIYPAMRIQKQERRPKNKQITSGLKGKV